MKGRNQRVDVLEYLQEHGSITQLDAYRNFPAPITRLSAVIYDLKRAGYNITDDWEKTKNCYGSIEYKRYFLVNPDKVEP